MGIGNSTIEKTMMTSFLFQGFWNRWIANGVPQETVNELRQRLNSLQDWIRILQKHADVYEQRAVSLCNQDLFGEAEHFYRLAGMHYNLIQWMFPETGDEKRAWYQSCKDMHREADILTEDEIVNAVIQVDGNACYGRIRIPRQPKGCVIILNPLESSKEESITYEANFSRMGFITVSFDGPGQGETYVMDQYIATHQRWDLFVNEVIDFTATQYLGLPLYLFGSSSGGTWAIQGSNHPKVCSTVSVSPVIHVDVKIIPDYFKERLSYIANGPGDSLLPRLENFDHASPILLVHGQSDTIVKDESIYELYNRFPMEKHLTEYSDEGHGCNERTDEILMAAGEWYLGYQS
ncbi:alpha/beta hydrolase [Paenibacillus sp. FA6]|uniref:alpha/beta hydrolase n=1 Tax=Paenibacillus sp. FA6 TaxID=3413029 RepID=UPI003F657BC4